MDLETIQRMIADLENIGALDSSSDNASESKNILELGADYLIASSPRRSVSPAIRDVVMKRIDGTLPRVRTNAQGLVEEINPAFSAMCGYSFAEIRGRKPGSLLQGPDTEPECVEIIRKAVASESPCETEMYNYHKDGSRYRVKIRVQPRHDEDGQLLGFEATEIKLT